MKIFLIILAAAAFVSLLYLLRRKSADTAKTLDLFRRAKHVQTTKRGIKIYGEPLSIAELEAVDGGAAKAFSFASKCRGYTNKISHSDWSVFVLSSVLSPFERVPSYFYPFPNSEEKSKSYTVAGEYLISDSESTVIAVAAPQGDLSFAAEVVYNELEHGIERHNDEQAFYRNANAGHAHPLWADCRSDSMEFFTKPQAFGCAVGDERQ